MKRTLLAALFALQCWALPALAEDAAKKPAHPKVTWEQHFATANGTHDGHLTAEQAKTGYPSVFKHFAEIDARGKGFVTVDDVKNWHQKQRTQHQPPPENKLRPRNAFQPSSGAHPVVKASSSRVVPGATKTVGPDTVRPDDVPG
jgi:hypothetical protein